jgi:hypothetical protein
MSQTPFRSVQQRASQAEGISNLKAPDRSKQTAELARQQNVQNQNLQTVIGLNQQFTAFNQQTLSDIDINNQRLVQAQLSDNKELSFKARQMRQSQGLADDKMLADFDSQILNLKNSQQVTANQLKQQQDIARDNSITNFGESFLKFSQTLVEERAERINKANRRIQAGAMLDGFLSQLNSETPALDAAQQARVDANVTLSEAANADETAGRINDATELRSNNGFYNYGYAEGVALKAASSFGNYLSEKQKEFEDKFPFGSPDAYIMQQSFIRQATIDFIDKNNLSSIPPEVLNKYFARTALSAQAAVAKEFNDKNNQYVKKASVSRAVSELRTAGMPYQGPSRGAFNESVFASDVSKSLTVLIKADPVNASANVKKAYDALKADAKLGGNLKPLKTFIGILEGEKFFSYFANDALNDYPTFLRNEEKEVKREMDEISSERADKLLLQLERLDGITDIDTRDAKRNQILDQLGSLNDNDRLRVTKQVNDLPIINNKAATEARDLWLNSGERTAEDVRNFAELNKRQLGGDVYLDTVKIADQYAKVSKPDPAITDKFKQVKDAIDGLRPTIKQEQARLDASLVNRINNAVSRRQDQLQRRFNIWKRSEQRTSFEEFLKANKDLTESLITDKEFKTGFNEPLPTNAPGVKKTAIPNVTNGLNTFAFTTPLERQNARSGAYGVLEPSANVYLEVAEVRDQVALYEQGNTSGLLKDLSRAAGTKPVDFLRQQMDLMGIQGTVDDPKPDSFTKPKRGWQPFKSTQTFYAEQGLTANTADALSQLVVSLSSGNPNLGSGQKGLFDFNAQEQNLLYEFAESTSRDPLDPYTQLEYVSKKIDSFKTGNSQQKTAFRFLAASKPTNDQLKRSLLLLFPGINRTLLDRAILNMRN